MTSPVLTPTQYTVVVLSIAVGLAIDVRVDIVGQTAMSVAQWALMFLLLTRVQPGQRSSLMACLAIATAGELVLSLAWGLYVYRLGNVPFFIPPGHVLLLLLGMETARRLPSRAADAIFGVAALYAAGSAIAGYDTLGLGLFALLAAAWMLLPAQRRLYASTLVLALLLELYGTALGSWLWVPDVPWTGLVTTNPPLLAGAFYCALDALVAAIAPRIVPQRAAQAP